MKITNEQWSKIITAIATCVITILGVLTVQSCMLTVAVSKPNGNGSQTVGAEQEVVIDTINGNINLKK